MTPSERPVTLATVAAEAGVAVSTVSRALAGDPQVGAATAARVRALATELGYVPNVAARTLVNQRSSSLGLVTPDVTDPFHGQVVTGFQQRAAERGYSVILANGLGDAAVERSALRELAAHRVGGVAALGCVLDPAEIVDLVARIPIVLVAPEGPTPSRTPGRGRSAVPVLRPDDRAGMRFVVAHLVDRGYRRPCYVGALGGATQQLRWEAFAAAVGEQLMPVPMVYRSEGRGTQGLAAVAARIAQDGADVAVCYDDHTALHLMDALRHEGLRVPEEVAIVGFDDIPFARIAWPRLTTVAQPAEDIGRRCVDLLLASGTSGRPARSQVVGVELTVRDSTPPRPGRRSGAVSGDRRERRRTVP
jgi:LacI family transcriptional regulator